MANTMTNHPLLDQPVERWDHDDARLITCVIRFDADRWSAYVGLPENLHDAWGHPAEVQAALGLLLVSRFAQLHSHLDLGYPGWVSLHLDEAFAGDEVRQLLFQDAETVAAKVAAASAWLAGGVGRSVTPIRPERLTYDLRAIRDQLRRSEDGMSRTARIFLKAGQTAADPGAGYRSIDGPAVVEFEESLKGLSATVQPM